MTSKNKGFTLLEVMVALAVLAFGLGAMWKGLSQAFVVTEGLPDRVIARWIANNRIVLLQANGQWPGTRTYKGSLGMAGKNWYWEQQVSSTEDSMLRRVTVRVGRDPDSLSLFSLEGYIQRPRPPLLVPRRSYSIVEPRRQAGTS